MRRLVVWVFLVFLAGLPAASSQEPGIGFETIVWAIHPSMKGKEREILRAALHRGVGAWTAVPLSGSGGGAIKARAAEYRRGKVDIG